MYCRKVNDEIAVRKIEGDDTIEMYPFQGGLYEKRKPLNGRNRKLLTKSNERQRRTSRKMCQNQTVPNLVGNEIWVDRNAGDRQEDARTHACMDAHTEKDETRQDT